MIKVAINGFGRIGRLAFRQMITKTDLTSWQLMIYHMRVI